MKYSDADKIKALAIVKIFETSKPFGDYAAIAVLNDGAGISYGINQFTHRSGSLLAVVEHYLQNGGEVGRSVMEKHLSQLRSTKTAAIRSLAANEIFKKALKAAAQTTEVKAAQNHVAFERYLKPAIEACEGSGFMLPLSLSVIYDSINHGSWEKIRDRVIIAKNHNDHEKKWITEYVRQRHLWLRSIPRLRSSSYRTAFFLGQIMTGKWDLALPLRVHGVLLTKEILGLPAIKHLSSPADPANSLPKSADDRRLPVQAAQPISIGEYLDTVQKKVNDAAAVYDQIEEVVQTVAKRNDAAKSLWTTIAGSLWQTLWAVISFVIGLPKEVWLVVALIVAALVLFYLYRQIELGKIRETRFSGSDR